MAFTNEDLKKMLEECIGELTSLGYILLPVTDISFTNRRGRYRLAVCKYDSSSQKYDRRQRRYVGDTRVRIRITGTFVTLPRRERKKLKTLVMHELIHAVEDRGLYGPAMTGHGQRYDEIVTHVENSLGYKNINDNTACGMSRFLDEEFGY